MLITKTNLDIWYNEYRAQYTRSTKYIKSRGGKPSDLTPLTRAEFEVDFQSMHFDKPKLSGKQLAQRMAKDEVYVVSSKQAIKRAEAESRVTGKPVDVNMITGYMMGTRQNLWDELKEFRALSKELGNNSYQTNLLISQEIFGSL